MKLIDNYIRNTVIASTALVVLVVLGIESFMEFVGQLSAIGHGNYTIWKAFIYVPMQLPADLYQLFPMVGLLGCLVGLGRLASTSQLIVFRSSGISILRITWSVIKAAIIMIIVITVMGEYLSPILQQKANTMKLHAVDHPIEAGSMKGVWLHKGNKFVHVDEVLSPTQINNISVFQFSTKNNLLSAEHADHGVMQDGKWYLMDASKTIFSTRQLKTKKLKKEILPIILKPRLLQQTKINVQHQSTVGLLRSIIYRRESGLVTSQFELALWQRILNPFTTIVMICLGIPFIFGSLRIATTGSRVLTGIIIGFGFYMLNQFLGPVTLVYQFPPILAALLPTILFMSVFIILWRKVS